MGFTRQRGFSLIGLVAAVAIMMVLMGAAVPSWRYVMKDDHEEELYFRGCQIAEAIERYQRKNGNAYPPSFEVLVKGRYLRKAFGDPFAKEGEWRIIRPGEATPVGVPARGASPSPSPSPRQTSTVGGVGVIAGVASLNTDKSLRLFNGRDHYNEWLFVAGQPRVIGLARGPRPLVPGQRSPGIATPIPAPR
ncbi:MAG TPA: type II secretion system protein [Vicinamibacteria bacterium]|nr:type II secretion system protein [Vicinamibacteria bacterium]